ncbi:uncharacterized protein CEXT_247451 [Caerostris extrusa]|uniref:Ig-like domain-containing protein n=1 Tax=Caerostris extrusa TaxID=172846 RepID=A0AAV4XV00_CAEEX|nr:uncharacterized protein CEXT_247451 [Caerostris extrusa]
MSFSIKDDSFPGCSSSRSHIPLRINMLHIPNPVVTGDSVRLRCAYELGNETLYAVKWYKNMGSSSDTYRPPTHRSRSSHRRA